ncbi:MAG TPA: acyltransferase [Candidatus Acidoferrum sp.]|nr:acyltransferase [Candidatus Acidoferrum sp.]
MAISQALGVGSASAPCTRAEAPPAVKAAGHVAVLDGVRGVAILMVLFGHFYQTSVIKVNYPLAGKILGRVLAPSGYGVELFFVLSGFLITGILLDTKELPGYFGKFYMRRFLRIFPLYYGALAAVLLVLPLFVNLDAGGREIVAHQGWLWCYLANWPSAYIWDNSNVFLLGHFWSLAVEEHFYILWPAMVFLLSRRGLVRVCFIVLVMCATVRATDAIMGQAGPLILQWTTLTRVDGLAIGGLLAIALRTPELKEHLPSGKYMTAGLWVFGVLVMGLMLMPRQVHFLPIPIFSETIVVSFLGLAVLAALQAQPGELYYQMLSSRVLVAFGKYSYGIYVIHGILRPVFAKVFNLEHAPIHYGLAFVSLAAYYVFAIGVSFLLAWLSYNLMEKRFLALKRYFEYKPA